MGFAADTFKEALTCCHGDIDKAINMLVSNDGVLPPISVSSRGEKLITVAFSRSILTA